MQRLVVLAIMISGCGSPPAPPTKAADKPSAADAEAEAAPFLKSAREALVGHRAPPAVLEMLDGTHVELASLIGRQPIYLKFWATWCVPCREQMPHLEATFRAHGDELAVFAVDVGVNDPIENVREMVAAKRLAMPIAFDRDGSVAELFHLNITPQHVLIDRAGVVRFVGNGVTPELEHAIAEVIGPAGSAAPAVATPSAPAALPPLTLTDGSALELASRPHTKLVLTFASLFCDSYVADSRPAIGAACAAHAGQVEKLHKAHPEITWIIVAYPVWTAGDDIKSYRERLAVSVPIGIDRGNAWFHRFGVRNPYTTIVLDGAGTELGRVDGDGAGLAALLAR
ncbi:MAG: TlpA disulfide reductase family protein [Kofleriaceae bacterium]